MTAAVLEFHPRDGATLSCPKERARLRAWLEYVAQTAIDALDALDADAADLEDDETEIYMEDCA